MILKFKFADELGRYKKEDTASSVCRVCKKKITYEDLDYQTQGFRIHWECKERFLENPESYRESADISDKSFVLTLILCLFTGIIGIHRFYAGKIGTGILMMFTLGGSLIWVLVDLIRICLGLFKDIDGRIIKNQRAVERQ